ncbi:hypothetical protein LJB86_01920, partial [Deltaproteobacteria bacterium OttesenSCG-928-M10]|nr:hypothetical protein [Deltaproteobacteria bacterium OttesenSCG-928-M10]
GRLRPSNNNYNYGYVSRLALASGAFLFWPEADPSFQLPAEQHPAAQAEAGLPVLDKALGLVGLPGMGAL